MRGFSCPFVQNATQSPCASGFYSLGNFVIPLLFCIFLLPRRHALLVQRVHLVCLQRRHRFLVCQALLPCSLQRVAPTVPQDRNVLRQREFNGEWI